MLTIFTYFPTVTINISDWISRTVTVLSDRIVFLRQRILREPPSPIGIVHARPEIDIGKTQKCLLLLSGEPMTVVGNRSRNRSPSFAEGIIIVLFDHRTVAGDDLSRLTNTDQYVNDELNKQNVERFLTYDRNGNLLTLIRYADGVQSSNRQYTYIGNRLDRMEKDKVIAWDEIEVHPGGPAIVVPEKVTEDNGTAALDAEISIDTSAIIRPVDPGIILHSRYAHDRNGNLTYDMELQTDFAYNSLNLLEKAMRNDTIVAKYSYLADGTKLSAVNADDCGFAYRGSFTYRADAGGDRVFESTPFGGGRIVGTVDDETEVRYFLTDHLESVRVVATDQNNVLERNDYYPFGKRWDTASLPVSDNRDRFNGKEDQVFIGDCLADYGARCYNKLNGRWLAQDPLQQYHSPYVFCGNNPIRLIDLDGMEARDSTSVMIPPVIVYPSEDGEGGGHNNSFWGSPIPGYSLDEIYEAFKSSFK